jgi:hypothetical protein
VTGQRSSPRHNAIILPCCRLSCSAALHGSGLGVADTDEVAERGPVEFYREQVARLLRVAEGLNDPAARLELLDVATVFQKMAERAEATVAVRRDVSAKQSA